VKNSNVIERFMNVRLGIFDVENKSVFLILFNVCWMLATLYAMAEM